MRAVKTVGLVLNYYKNENVALALEMLEILKRHKLNYLAFGEDAKALGLEELSADEFCRKVDLVMVIGGDGTLLRAARIVYGYEIGILGINRGYLGFLSELEIDEFEQYLDQIVSGEYHMERRTMLEADAYRGDKLLAQEVALNDMVITKGALARLIDIKVKMNDTQVENFLGLLSQLLPARLATRFQQEDRSFIPI